jgi:hypothetical protein
MGGVKVKIRGIYATALTGLLLERGFEIVSPSELIQARFGLTPNEAPEEALIIDRRDRQGVLIEGVKGAVEEVVGALRDALVYAVFFPLEVKGPKGGGGNPFAALLGAKARFLAEFPQPVKELLDQIRARYVPTLPGHHHLKVVDSQRVDEVEGGIPPEELPAAAARLREELIYRHFEPGRTVEVWHGKARGGFSWRGVVAEFVPGEVLVLERRFRAGGTYDSLELPKLEGDHGTVELYEGRWWGRRRYFRADGTPIGEIYNIHTPPELYPHGVRYLDLEVDVVRYPNGEVMVVDVEVLVRKAEEGLIPKALADRALHEARTLAEGLKRDAGDSPHIS